MAAKGNLFIIAAPSGTGKTTLVKALVERCTEITVSISHTTRAKRPNEENGVHYHFVTLDTIKSMIQQHQFLEYAKIFDHYYGTSKEWVENTLKNGVDVILEIDWQGHQQIKTLFPQAIGIFILPPSFETLEKRLVSRQQDAPQVIEKRLADTENAVSHIQEFNYVVINDDLEKAVNNLKNIVMASRLQTHRQLNKYAKLINDLTHH